jgi:hypothetical protein
MAHRVSNSGHNFDWLDCGFAFSNAVDLRQELFVDLISSFELTQRYRLGFFWIQAHVNSNFQ